jgi:hypothetical protein
LGFNWKIKFFHRYHMILNHCYYSTHKFFSLHYPLLGSGFQRRTFLFLCVPELFRASATSFSLLTTVLLTWLRVRVNLWLAVYRQSGRHGTKPLETHDGYFFQPNTCGYSPKITSSLTIAWVCHLRLLLALASAVILWSASRGTHDHILVSQIRDFPNLVVQIPVFISPRNRVVQLYPQALGSHFVASYDSSFACSLVAGETTYPQSCSLATALVLLPAYTAVTWQWVYMSQY